MTEDYGIPPSEVRFIQECKTDKARKAVIDAMNAGTVRVLFGSTSMLGTGVNAQKRCVAIHHLDTPWRPSDLQQRDGRGVRAGNEIAKHFAGNNVDVIIYAVEKSLDSYKFNLLHCKQTFISQLKSGAMGARTIDEGAMDEKSGMNFSEYMALLSGNTDLLDNVGYIRIRQFDGTTPSELDYALRTLTANGAASLVFDLRDNGGGILEDAVNCIDLIAPEGTVAYAEDKNGNRTVIGSSDAESAVSLPMVCLVNGNTASAAELFAATLRTMNGARLVGTTTMGKGTIQSSPQRLSDGSAVVITVAKLVCGDGSCFDGTGLTVDVERALSTEEATNFYDYTPQTDPQVQRAVSAAQQLSGTTTLAGASSAAAADSTAASTAADDTAPAETAEGEPAEGETAASEPETAASAAE